MIAPSLPGVAPLDQGNRGLIDVFIEMSGGYNLVMKFKVFLMSLLIGLVPIAEISGYPIRVPSLHELIEQSDVIIVGTPISVPSRFAPRSRGENPPAIIHVTEVLKGNLKAKEISLNSHVSMVSPTPPNFIEGETELIFLKDWGGELAINHLSHGVRPATEETIKAWKSAIASWQTLRVDDRKNSTILTQWYVELGKDVSLRKDAGFALNRFTKGDNWNPRAPIVILTPDQVHTLTNLAFNSQHTSPANYELLKLLSKDYPTQTVASLMYHLSRMPEESSENGPVKSASQAFSDKMEFWWMTGWLLSMVPDDEAAEIHKEEKKDIGRTINQERLQRFLARIKKVAIQKGYLPIP